jgi:hypothetical protein
MENKNTFIASIEEHQAEIIADLEALKMSDTAADLEGLLENQKLIVGDLEQMMRESSEDA